MRGLGLTLFATSLVFAAPLAAASPIDGTWKTDPSKIAFAQRPQTYVISDGKFSCETCTPPYSITADGKLHATPGRPYADEASAMVVDDMAVKLVQRQKGKEVGSMVARVSADGATLTSNWQSLAANGTTSKGTDTLTRVAAAPAGAHAVSGSWQMAKTSSDSKGAFEQTFMMKGDTLHLTTPDGESYEAKLGGPAVPIKGDRANTMVSVAKTGERSFVETGMRDGKPVYAMTITVSEDGKSIDVATENKLTSATTKLVAYKQ